MSQKDRSAQARFLKPRAACLQTPSQDFGAVDVAGLTGDLQHIVVTTALLESRAHLYGGYLAAVFHDKDARWLRAVRQWNDEEAEHGRILMQLSNRLPLTTPPAVLLSRYLSAVPYHARNGISVRGSVGQELVARCVVEALASTYYRALADGATDTTVRDVILALARDEARHFGMFRRMLEEERLTDASLTTMKILLAAIRRMIALEDEHIGYASYLVSIASGTSTGAFSPRVRAHVYAGTLYPLYKFRHLHYAAGMLLIVVNYRSAALQHFLAVALWFGVRAREVVARVALRFCTSKAALEKSPVA